MKKTLLTMISIFWVGSLFAEFIKIDDFETYTTGQPPPGASMPGPDGMPNPDEGPWWNHLDVVADRATDPHIRVVEDPFDLGQGNVLEIYPGVPLSTSSLNHTTTRSLTDDQSIKNNFDDLDQVSTFYFRIARPLVNGVPGEADLTWGMVAEPEARTNEDGTINPLHTYGSYSVLGRIETNGSFDIRDGTDYIDFQEDGVETMDTQTWYEFWFVVHHFTWTFEQYIRGGTDYPVQTKITWDGNPEGKAAYRRQVGAPLDTILLITSAGAVDAIKGKDAMYLDDFYVDPTGRNLNSPGVVSGLVVLDFEDDTVGQQPNVSGATFSPSSNDANNGAVVIDSTSDPANPLEGQSLYIYDGGGEGPTHFRFPIKGGENLTNIHLSFDFQRAYAAEDTDTRVHVALGRAEDRLNSSANRPFQLRLRNDGNVIIDAQDNSNTTIGPYNTDAANTINVLANSHDTDSLDYNLALGMGTIPPNSLHLFLNGENMGEFNFYQDPSPGGVGFYMQDADLGQFALFQDTNRAGGIVFDNIVLNQLKVDVPPPPTEGKFINISTRSRVGTGPEVMIGSFVIREGGQQVLIQARGPELANDGIANALTDPVLTVKRVAGADGTPEDTLIGQNDDWEANRQDIVDIWARYGLLPNTADGSLSSAIVLNLDPGSYSAIVEGKDGTTGVALVEVYETD